MGHRRRNDGERGRTPWPAPRAPVPPPRTLRICAISTRGGRERTLTHGCKRGCVHAGSSLCGTLSTSSPFFLFQREKSTHAHTPPNPRSPKQTDTPDPSSPTLTLTLAHTKKNWGTHASRGCETHTKRKTTLPPFFFPSSLSHMPAVAASISSIVISRSVPAKSLSGVRNSMQWHSWEEKRK